MQSATEEPQLSTIEFVFSAIFPAALIASVSYVAFKFGTRYGVLGALAGALYFISRASEREEFAVGIILSGIIGLAAVIFGKAGEERKKTKEKKENAQAALDTVEAKENSNLPAALSHETREEMRREDFMNIARRELAEPFARLDKYISLFKSYIGKFNDEKANVFIERIERQFRRIDRILERLLHFARIDFENLPLRIERFDIRKLFLETTEMLERSSAKHTIIFLPETHSFALGDRFRIRKVLEHLIRNAIRHSPQGGKIIVGLKIEDGNICAFIRDFGVGLTEEEFEEMNKAFASETYVRYEKPAELGKLGVGLYTSNAIIRLHGGTMRVKGRRGKGTVFYFTLPMALQEQSTMENRE